MRWWRPFLACSPCANIKILTIVLTIGLRGALPQWAAGVRPMMRICLTYLIYHSKKQEGKRTSPRAIKSIKSTGLIRR